MRELVLIGGGGHCKSVIGLAEQLNCKIKGILDLAENRGKSIAGHAIIGTDDDIVKYVDSCDFVITVGFIKNSSIRNTIFKKVIGLGGNFVTLISPYAYVSSSATIGSGTVVLQSATINTEAQIGHSCIINTGAIVEHDSCIGNFTHVSTGAIVNGGASIDENVFVGSNSVVSNGISICSNSIIGAGTVVIRNISKADTYVGNPAQKTKNKK